jgi:O-antigen ligase
MVYRQTNRQPKPSGPSRLASMRQRARLIGPGSIAQWSIIGTVGLVLGSYILAVTTLSSSLMPLLILAVLVPFIAMVVGSVQRLLLGLILLDIPFPLDFHLNYRTDVAELNAIGGISISVTTIALVILYALWLAESLSGMNQQSRPRVLTITTLALAAYLAFAILSVAVARDITLAFYEIFMLIQTFLLYIYVVANVRTRQDVLFIVTVLLIGLVLESLVMIGLRFVGHSIRFIGMSALIESGRVAGTAGSPNATASYLILFMPPAMSMLLNRVGRAYRWLALLAFGLSLVALTLTLSRGGWLGFALSMALLYLSVWRRGKLSSSALLTVVCSALLLSVLFRDTIATRLAGEDASPLEARIILIQLASSIIEDHPLFGIGANNFVAAITQYATPEFSGDWLHVVHNKYLLVWAEIGIGGLLAFLLFLITAIRKGWQGWRFNDPLLSPLALGFTAGIVGQLAHMFFDLFHSRLQVQSLWLVAALIVAIRNMNAISEDKKLL